VSSPVWPVCGHERILALLSHEMASGSVRHAYLFSGPRHSGKSTIAKAFARAIVCAKNADGQPPCEDCDDCKRVDKGIHPDVQVFSLDSQRVGVQERGESSTDRLSVESAREISAAAAYMPFTARRRVIIVEDAETLTATAQEALLKTIEEPPPHLVLMLLAESADLLKATILSRCEQLNLLPVPTQTIATCLVDRGVDQDVAVKLSKQATGLPGLAMEMALDPTMLESRHTAFARAGEWIAATPFERVCRSFALANDFGKSRQAVFDELETLGELWRSVMMHSAGVETPATERVSAMDVLEPLKHIELVESLRALESVMTCMSDLESNVRPRLALEAMVMQWPSTSTETTR
jgi:DNA polymerase-3 subunit delta'